MKKIISFMMFMVLFASCQQSKEGIVKDFIEAENNVNTEKMSRLLADSFIYYGSIDTLNKEDYLSWLDSSELELSEVHVSILNMQELDSIVKTDEQICTIADKYLEVTPLIVQKRTYRFADNKIKSINVDTVLNYEEYAKSFNEKWTPFAFWIKDKYDIDNDSEFLTNVGRNFKKYLTEYINLPASDKKQYKRYAHLQGTYVSDDCAFYKKLKFKGKRTVTIIDAIWGFPFATSYELDEDLIKIKTDRSDLLFEIKDSQTLIGEGFAEGTFIKIDD